MKISLDDSRSRENLYPFTATRHVADIRVGILTIREKWALLEENNFIFQKEENLIIPANIIPTIQNLQSIFAALSTNNVLQEDAAIRFLLKPWNIFELNDWALRKDFELITGGRKSQPISATNKITAPQNVFIEQGASVEHCIINAATGPVYIGKNSTVMEGCIIRGPFALCESATLKLGAKIYGATTIGPNCVAGGEIKNSILFSNSNKAHDGYLGDSVIGEWCNLGAGTTNSNLKNTAGKVNVWNNKRNNFEAVGSKCGLLMGDYSRCAINTSFNTGTVVGVCCNIFGVGFPPKFVTNFSWGKEQYEFEKVLQDIDNWKKLKGSRINTEEKIVLKKLYNHKNNLNMRKQIAAANWKMNLTLQQGEVLVDELIKSTTGLNEHQEVVFAVPFPYLTSVKAKLALNNHVFVAAQNCYNKISGAYTGEISAEILKSIGTDFVIIGHSERREYFGESNATLAEKINICLEYQLKPIFCCGEALDIREAGTQNSFVEKQISESLFHLSAAQITNFVIAYEPIWAIGTGKTATSAQAQEIHAFIREVLAAKYGKDIADTISILYGGSVKANNAKEIFGQPDVDGGLVGGASLMATEFAAIIKSLK